MNINKISKQFVEQDEEIVFVIEKLLESPGDRVILILPHISALTSSAVSLKILANQILDSKKLAVLVTDNLSADKLCQRANLAVRSKISEVDKDAWIEAKNLKLKMAENRDRLKKELLGARNPGSDEVGIMSGIVPAKVIDDVDDNLASQEIKPIMEKPRIKPKVIDISGIKLVAGGDIAETEELLHLERQRLNSEDEVEEFDDEDDYSGKPEDRLVGNDIASSYVGKTRFPRNKNSMTNKLKQGLDNVKDIIMKPGRGRKIALGVLALLVIGFFYSYFFLSRVDFTLFLDKETGAVLKSISADADLAQSNIDGQVLKAEMISKTVSQINEGGQPTGKKQTGTPASGEIEIDNLTSSPITLPKGTILTRKSTTLKYKTTEVATIPAATDSAIGKILVDVEAETFGVDYNVDGLAEFTVGSYATTDVKGWTLSLSESVVQEVTVVSKEDIEAIKASLTDQIKFELNNSLTELLSSDDILLSGSQVFTEVSFTTSVKEGEEVVTQNDEAPTFKSELKMTITAMKISKSELKTLIEKIALADKGADSGLKVTVTDPVIDNVVINVRKATFDIRTNASYTADLDVEKLKDLIKGKSIDEAKTILGRFNGVKEVRSRYTPPFIPFGMQVVPDDKGRFDIVSAPYN